MNPTRHDTLIILGDVGINFHGGFRDVIKKDQLAQLPITVFSIHGNHEMQPDTIASYHTMEWHVGQRFVGREMFLALANKVVVGNDIRFLLRDVTEWEAQREASDEPDLVIPRNPCPSI